MKVDLYNSSDGMSNYEVISKANKLELPNLSYFMRVELCNAICKKQECGVVNLNTSKQQGSHHTCHWVANNKNITSIHLVLYQLKN